MTSGPASSRPGLAANIWTAREASSGPNKKKGPRRRGPEPAPGDLRIVQDFLNTVHLKEGTDELAQPRGLSDWLARHGLLGGAANLPLRADGEGPSSF